MSNSIGESRPSASAITRFWQRVPIVIRAIVLGYFVFAIAGSVARIGIDSHFVVWVLVFVASGALFSWTARKTLAARRQT